MIAAAAAGTVVAARGIRIVANPERRDRLVTTDRTCEEVARDRICANFSIEQGTQRLPRLYAELTAGPTRR